MSGWLFIIVLLLLGGLISTLGDLLGSKIGKARFSILKLRPKKNGNFNYNFDWKPNKCFIIVPNDIG